jgi:hypothetical protein
LVLTNVEEVLGSLAKFESEGLQPWVSGSSAERKNWKERSRLPAFPIGFSPPLLQRLLGCEPQFCDFDHDGLPGKWKLSFKVATPGTCILRE